MSSSGFLRALDAGDPVLLDDTNKQSNQPPADESSKRIVEEEYRGEAQSREPIDEIHRDVNRDEIDKREDEREEENPDADNSNKRKAKWDKAKLLKEKNRELERQNLELYEKMQTMDHQLKEVYNSNIHNYGTNVATNLDIATREYEDALEHGSVKDITAATASYTMALNEFHSAKKIVEDHNIINEQYQNERARQQSQQTPVMEEVNYDAHQSEWLRENPELDSKSKYYDRNLEKKIMSEAEKLNDYLISGDSAHLIGSRQYLDKLDEFVEYYKNNNASNNLRGYGVTSQNKISSGGYNTLSEKEAAIAAASGMSAEEYRAAQARMPESLRLKQQMLRGGR